MTILLAGIFKISIVIAMGLALAALLRRRSAAVRHWVLAMTIVCAAAVPLLEMVVPAWGIALPGEAPTAGAADTTASIAPASPAQGVLTRAELAPAQRRTGLSDLLVPAWTLGAGISLLVLVVGFARLMWLAARARPVEPGPWTALAETIGREYGLRRPVRLLESEHPSLLVTWGLVQPKVIIPHAARAWSDERIAIVLRHELAHISRGDWLVQIAGELVRSIYWFNPLLWIACTRLRLESEQACDDEVLSRGVDGENYATHLLELARTLKAETAPHVPAPAVARHSSLERRIRAMLDAKLTRTPATRSVRFLTAAALLALTTAISAAQTGPVKLTGSVFDSTGAPVPGVTVALVNSQTQARHEVKTDQTGYYEFVPLPADSYKLQAAYPGMSKFEETVKLSGSSARRDVTMALGSLQETVTVGRGGESARTLTADKVTIATKDGRRAEMRGDVVVFHPPVEGEKVVDEGGRVIIIDECKPSTTGGRIRPPRKLKDVRPVYPAHLREAGITGTVRLKAVIGTDGLVREVIIEKSAHPELDNSAVEAVRQWKFDGTLLNCSPVEVTMSVGINFQ